MKYSNSANSAKFSEMPVAFQTAYHSILTRKALLYASLHCMHIHFAKTSVVLYPELSISKRKNSSFMRRRLGKKIGTEAQRKSQCGRSCTNCVISNSVRFHFLYLYKYKSFLIQMFCNIIFNYTNIKCLSRYIKNKILCKSSK